MAKIWRTLEELNADHERLVADVEELKKQFEAHGHETGGYFGGPTGKPLLYVDVTRKKP